MLIDNNGVDWRGEVMEHEYTLSLEMRDVMSSMSIIVIYWKNCKAQLIVNVLSSP